jgi:hypothetical protein
MPYFSFSSSISAGLLLLLGLMQNGLDKKACAMAGPGPLLCLFFQRDFVKETQY